jgi:hypothetical protein
MRNRGSPKTRSVLAGDATHGLRTETARVVVSALGDRDKLAHSGNRSEASQRVRVEAGAGMRLVPERRRRLKFHEAAFLV